MTDNQAAVATVLILLFLGAVPALPQEAADGAGEATAPATTVGTTTRAISLGSTAWTVDGDADVLDTEPGTETDLVTSGRAGRRMEPRLLERLQEVSTLPVVLHFTDAPARDAAAVQLEGARPLGVLPALNTRTTTADLEILMRLPGLDFVERADKPLHFAMRSARDASNVTAVVGEPTAGVPPLHDNEGRPFDGRGIGVAIVDTGVDPTHPDVAPRLGGSWIVHDDGVVAAPDPDPIDAHGTLIAGIVAGTGATDHPNRGVATNATLYSFDIGPAATNLHAARAFDWIHTHGHELDPPIRVVVNAWGCFSGACRIWDPQQLHIALARSLAENGTTMVFAAGNEGGNGLVSTVHAEAIDSTPGILGIGAFDDRDIGTRESCVSRSSSMGALEEPATWPDLIAPGDWTWAPNGVHLSEDSRVPVLERKSYRYLHGTSAAAAHTGGIVALMLQADPGLHPADIEYALKATAEKIDCGLAYVRGDATHPWGSTHPRMGHGLIDARLAIDLALDGFSVPQDEPALEDVPSEWLDMRQGTEVRHVRYLTRDGGLSTTYPEAPLSEVRLVRRGEPAVFSTGPLGADMDASAARIDLWWGTFAECVCARVTAPRFVTTLERVQANGTVAVLDAPSLSTWHVHAATPVQRPLSLSFPETSLQATDSLRLTVAIDPTVALPLVATEFLLYLDAPETASRLALGVAARADHGEAVWCQVRQDCADVGGERLVEGLHCANVPMRVDWSGPGGSGIVLACNGEVVSCRIPTQLEEGTCSTESVLNPSILGHKTATCRYFTADGALTDGAGRCHGLILRKDKD